MPPLLFGDMVASHGHKLTPPHTGLKTITLERAYTLFDASTRLNPCVNDTCRSASFEQDGDALQRTWREARWLDASLAEIIAQYEISAPEYHPDRLVLAFVFLDEMISVLELTSIDARIWDICRCVHGAAPVINVQPDCVRAAMGPELGRDRDDECRRVRWAALSLATSLCTECLVRSRPDKCVALSICDPANYLVLLPNELCNEAPGLF
ncbi:hypothetical protein B0H14DRAFT_3564701 [Mycena olivaceomarginata]|nr:hypothetical protein B0H14DRAFT_3564701 [Mycena olivaceomarginata]